MPELPEVETVRRQLSEVVVGKRIIGVEVLRRKSFLGDESYLVGKEIGEVKRKAKVLEFEFVGASKVLVCHLKMTGQLVYVSDKKRVVGGHPTADWVAKLPSNHTRVVLVFEDGSKLYFNDMRVFGWLKLVSKMDFQKENELRPVDVIDVGFDSEYLKKKCENSRRPIKLLILDQSLVGGIGNIYANDALNLARINPLRFGNSLKMGEVKKLVKALKLVINKGIELGGASAANYVDLRGMGGSYQDHFLVYKRDGKECKNCGSKILKVKLGGRGTFYCSKCQK